MDAVQLVLLVMLAQLAGPPAPWRLPLQGGVREVRAVATDGRAAVTTSGDGSVLLWDLRRGTARPLGKHRLPPGDVGLWPGARSLTLLAADLERWDRDDGKPLANWKEPG